jgi:hypothetical protein
MSNEEARHAYRTPEGREAALNDHEDRIEKLERWKTVAEYKEKGREKKVNWAITGVISLGVAIASGVVVALLSGGGTP